MPESEIVSGKALLARSGEDGGRFRPTATMPKSATPDRRRRWERLGTRAARSYRAAVELHCLDCVCWYRTEARGCAISTCSLWALNRRIFGGDAEGRASDDRPRP